MIERLDAAAHVADPAHGEPLADELGPLLERHGDLFLAPGTTAEAAWALASWLDVHRVTFTSIADGARQIRSLGRAWWTHHPGALFRRGELLLERLPRADTERVAFPPERARRGPVGAFVLLDANTALASARTTRPFAGGRARFVEDRTGPPGRAYRKLWEAWMLLGCWPRPGERVVDLGASPGGWTWAAARLGAQVLAIDKAPLGARLSTLPGVTTLQASAFAPAWQAQGPFDWVLSDVVCFPERLLGALPAWRRHAPNVVATVKFRGRPDPATVAAWKAVPGGRLVHLAHNKNELTWLTGGAGAPSTG